MAAVMGTCVRDKTCLFVAGTSSKQQLLRESRDDEQTQLSATEDRGWGPETDTSTDRGNGQRVDSGCGNRRRLGSWGDEEEKGDL